MQSHPHLSAKLWGWRHWTNQSQEPLRQPTARAFDDLLTTEWIRIPIERRMVFKPNVDRRPVDGGIHCLDEGAADPFDEDESLHGTGPWL